MGLFVTQSSLFFWDVYWTFQRTQHTPVSFFLSIISISRSLTAKLEDFFSNEVQNKRTTWHSKMVQKVKQIIILYRDISKLMFFIVPGLKWMQLPPRQLRHKVLPILEVLGDPIAYLVALHIFVHLDLDSQVLPDRPDLCLCEKSTRMDFSKGCLTMRKRARHWANSWKQTGKKKYIWSSSSDVAVSWKKGNL